MVAARHLMNCSVSRCRVLSRSVESRPRWISSTWEPVSGTTRLRCYTILATADAISHVLARVIERDPDWTALPPTTPSLVVRLLRRCLEKDVRRRLRDIADAKRDLEDATQLDMAGAAATRPCPVWSTAAAWTLAAVATIVSAWSFTRGAPQRASEPLRFTIAIPAGEEIPMEGGLPPPVAISRDGHSIAYVTRRLGDGTVHEGRADRLR